MASLISRASRAFDSGLESVGRPFNQPGAPITTAEPFSPGSTSVGALTAKLIRNIISGSRRSANDVEVRAGHDREVQRQGLEMQGLEQNLKAGELVDFTDEDGTVSQVPRRALALLLKKRTGVDPAWAMDPKAVGSPAWSRVQTANRPRAGAGAGGPKAAALNASSKQLDAEVQREIDARMNTLAAPRGRTLAANARAGDTAALAELRINPDIWALATTDNSVNARTARSLLEQSIASGLRDWQDRIGLYFKDQVQKKYSGKYKRLAEAADKAAQLEDSAPEEVGQNAAFEEQAQGAFGRY